MASVAMIDDEPLVGRALRRWLERRGFALEFFTQPAPFMRRARERVHDLLVLDERLGPCRGSELCAELRAEGDRRAIALVACWIDAAEGKAVAQECGADVFAPKEPAAILRALHELGAIDPERPAPLARCRHEYAHAFTSERITIAGGRVSLDSHEIVLPRLQSEALAYLLRRGPDVVSVEELRRAVWKCAVSRQAITNVLGALARRLPGWIERSGPGYRARTARPRDRAT